MGYWNTGSVALPAGATALATQSGFANRALLISFSKGGALGGANTAAGRRALIGTVNSNPANWNSNLKAVLSRSLAFASCSTNPYAYRRAITVAAGSFGASCGGSPSLPSFPLLIRIAGDNALRTAPTGHVQSPTGYDIVFKDATGNRLDHEIESYVGASGDLVAWVRVPNFVPGTLFMEYGRSGVSSPTANPTGVWDSGYRYVYHVGESAGNPLDSTANSVVATVNPSGDPGATVARGVAGTINGALRFVTPPTFVPPLGTPNPANPTQLRISDPAVMGNTSFTIHTWCVSTLWRRATWAWSPRTASQGSTGSASTRPTRTGSPSAGSAASPTGRETSTVRPQHWHLVSCGRGLRRLPPAPAGCT